jgi:hypothetical protein
MASDQKDFRFTDPRQERIYRRLLLIGPGPAAFYRDACRLMDQGLSFETTPHLVAHSLREIESAIRAVLLPHDFTPAESCKTCGNRPEAHKKQIETIVKIYDLGSSVAAAWYRLVGSEEGGLARLAHRNALLSPRQVSEILKKTWDEVEALFDAVLAKFETDFLRSFEQLDTLLAKRSPTANDVKLLKNKVPNNLATLGYFFDKLDNPAWLEALRREGFFRHPPELTHHEDTGTIDIQRWPESRYLSRMAGLPEYHEKVLEIALEIPETQNLYVRDDLIDIMLALPPNLAARLLSKTDDWLWSPHHVFVPEKLGSLLSHLAKGDQVDSALKLARSLLSVVPGPSLRKEPTESEDESLYDLPPVPQARFDLWYYEQIVKRNVPDLVSSSGMKAFLLLCDLLETAINLSQRENAEGPEDYSYIRRHRVEDLGEMHAHQAWDVLVSAVRDAGEQIVKAEPKRVSEIVTELDQRRWRIFHRMGLHLLRVFSDAAPELVAAKLTNRDAFDDLGRLHEYRTLMQSQFSSLAKPNQDKILGMIEQGPDLDDFKELVKERQERDPTPEEIENYAIRWRLEHLMPIRDLLPSDWKKRREEWVAKVGEPEEMDSYPRSWVGPTSPKGEEELRSMSVSEIVGYLRTWQPSSDPMTPSPEGLGRILTAVVTGDPEQFAAETQQFMDLDPTYVRALIRGLHDAVKRKCPFPWPPVLELCRWVVEQPREIPGRKSEYGDLDPGWGWTRKTIAELLSAGFENGPTEIPFELRSTAWEILRPLTEDLEPTPEYEDRYGGSNMDPATLSINTTRGEAMHSVLQYALWVRRNIEKLTDASERLARGFDEMPEVRDVFEKHLDVSQDTSLAIRSVYGRWFPWLVLLDPAWAKANAAQIFPVDDSQCAFWNAAWRTYVLICRPYDSVLDVLGEQYSIAIERLFESDNEGGLADPGSHLAEHLMEFYRRGKLDSGDEKDLFARFWERASDKIRGHALEFAGRSLKSTPGNVPPEILNRLKFLWEGRLAAAKMAASADSHKAELASFGWWFVSEKFEDGWAIMQLKEVLMLAGAVDADHWVMERLATLAPSIPLEAVQCLRLVIEGERENWGIHVWRDEAHIILTTALHSGNPEAKSAAVELINILAARRHIEFRDLLKDNS